MGQLLIVVGALCFAGSLVTAGWALLASEPQSTGAWRAVAALGNEPGAVRVRGRVVDTGAGWRAPRGGQPCAWSVTWMVGSHQGVGATGRRTGGVELFERSAAPVVVQPEDGREPLVLDPRSLWVQVAPEGVPFGASAIDRGLERLAPQRSYARWAAGPQGDRTAVALQELVLEHGSEVTIVGRPGRDAGGRATLAPAGRAGGVLVLQGDGDDLEAAGGRAARSRATGRRRWRLAAGLLAVAVSCLAVGAGATAASPGY